MSKLKLSRRDFFKLNAFGAGTLALTSVVGSPHELVAQGAGPASADAPLVHAPQPTFAPISSQLQFGTIQDISAGWDGTLWAVDQSGAPHLYDSIQNQWNSHGTGVDAVCNTSAGWTFFRNNEVVVANTGGGPPQPIAVQYPNLPNSFQLGVTGAANARGVIYLFKAGRYIRVDGSAPAQALNSFSGWPTSAAWKDGIVDIVGSGDGSDSLVVFIRSGQVLIADIATRQVTYGPVDLSAGFGGGVLALLQAGGVDALLYQGTVASATTGIALFRGPVYITCSGSQDPAPTSGYIARLPNWPAEWNPTLRHAPSGRVGNLWAAMADGLGVVYHDGQGWNVISGQATWATVGQDHSVFTIGAGGNTIYQWAGGSSFNLVGTSSNLLNQVSAGDANSIWVRDNTNAVSTFTSSNGAFTPNPVVGQATHLAADYDGTVWHCQEDSNAYRFNTGNADTESLGIPQAGGAQVNRVASTGFGTAFCLAQPSGTANPTNQPGPQLYAYRSPYVFKSKPVFSTYGELEHGSGRVFLIQNAIYQQTTVVSVVALDAHTGQLLWQNTVAQVDPNTNVLDAATTPVFDLLHNLVYVGIAPGFNSGYDQENTSPRNMYALDVVSGRIVWQCSTRGPQNPGRIAGIDAPPTLVGTQLCFGDRLGYLHSIDTAQALAYARANPVPTGAPEVTPVWSIHGRFGAVNRMCTPLISDGKVYYWTLADAPNITEYVSDNSGIWLIVQSVVAMDGSEVYPLRIVQLPDGQRQTDLTPTSFSTSQGPYLLHAQVSVLDVAIDSLFVVAPAYLNQVVRIDLAANRVWPAPGSDAAYTLPANGIVDTGLAYANGNLWFFGSNNVTSSLFGLDTTTLQPVKYTPLALGVAQVAESTPVIYTDRQNRTTIFASTFISGVNTPTGLLAFNPDLGVTAQVPIGNNVAGGISRSLDNGVIYVGPQDSVNTGVAGLVGQVFGIRVDTLVSSLRDFVIESQLMQDPDPAAGNTAVTAPDGNILPPSVARYQTHVTVVDDNKAPRPFEAVKLWASEPNTQVVVNGTAATIGPDDSSFVVAQTDASGQITIVSDATDMFAISLRLWAGFMDPYERIVIHPDQEFHQRVMTSHAQTDSTQPNYADPDTVNLSTNYSYDGKPLFTGDEKDQGLPTQTASAIQQMGSATGVGGSGSGSSSVSYVHGLGLARPRGHANAHMLGMGVQAAGVPGKYTAYTDLSGMSYFPANTPAVRPAQAVAPTGLQLTRTSQGQHTAQTLSPADAASEIDALTGAPWINPNPLAGRVGPAGAQRVEGFWSDFWNWLTNAVATIENIVVSVAEDVYVGIQFVVNGVEQVFKAVVSTLEDVVAAIGSFFIKLGKLIKNAIEALSIVFHFGEIKKTHIVMRNELLNRVNGIPGNASYPGIANAIADSAIPALNQFFGRGEDAINGFFDQLKGYITGKNLNTLQGQGTTEHTLYTNTSKSTGQRASRAVQCSWGMKKMSANARSASVGGGSAGLGVQGLPQSLQDFFTTFTNRIRGDGDLAQDFSDFKSDFNNLLHPNSAEDFLGAVLATLLDVLKTLFDAALAITNALLDGLLKLAADIVELIFDAQTGWINQTINIPVISWLYQLVFGEPLTLLNLLTLVAAIPITLIYRVATGRYPSQDVAVDAQGMAIASAHAVGDSNGIALIMGLFGSLLAAAGGIVSAIGDSYGTDPAPPAVGWIALVIGFLSAGVGFPLASGSAPGLYDWSNWGMSMGIAAVNIPGVISFDDPLAAVLTPLLPFLLSELSAGAIALSVVDLVETANSGFVNDFGLGLAIAGAIPGVINPLKLIPQELLDAGPITVAIVDGAMGFAMGVLEALLAFDSDTTPAPVARRLYFPFVPVRR